MQPQQTRSMQKLSMGSCQTNIYGTINLIDVAVDYNVNRFVLVSTDKAVNPSNIMGATKFAEKLIQSRSYNSNVKFMAVRFGNVIGSSGSVIYFQNTKWWSDYYNGP